MTYQVLARKWRPKNFSTLTGQEAIVQALTNALTQQRLHHAYLFTGTRGVGKTTLARILAKCLNCDQGISATPCEQCLACEQINQGRYMDLIEVDAASKTKVEDTRELLDNVQYAPSQGRFKIYLIDEVHMLSTHSFNALLKTLEEPPAHSKFLLATTDPHKLPATVISRCIQFRLNAMTPEQIQQNLAHILNEEKISFEPRALQHLAYAANGSMRDGLSLLDQAITHGNQQVRTESVRAMLGLTKTAPLLQLVEQIHHQKTQEVIDTIQALAQEGTQFDQLLNGFLSVLHVIAMQQASPDYDCHDQDHPETISTLSKQISKENIQVYYQIALSGQRDLPLAPSLKSGFEMIALRMMALVQPADNNHNATKTSPVELAKPSVLEKQSASTPRQPAKVSSETATDALPLTKQANWSEIINQLKVSGLTKSLLKNTVLADVDGNKITLHLKTKHKALLNPQQTKAIEACLQEYTQKPLLVQIIIQDETDSPPSPQEIDDQNHKRAKEEAHSSLANNQNVQQLLDSFDGTIIPESAELVTQD